MKIAILLTCFNRKEFTLKCLDSLYEALSLSKDKLKYSIYLTDDGSTDGTSLAVLETYPNINVLKGNGNLYWAGGMRNSWNEALKNQYDGYLLLNDDTFVFENLFLEILKGIDFCKKEFNKNGILIGSTQDAITKKLTYGGSNFINKFKGTYKILEPSANYQDCELGNANIMYVHKDVVDKIGVLSKEYTHGVADYDYTYNAFRSDIPVMILPNFYGYCSTNVLNKNEFLLNLKSIKERYRYLVSPIGLAIKDNLYYQKKFFPNRLFIVCFMAIIKVLFPRLYIWFNNKRITQ
jgi:GT2 family glycosyltransferase